MEKTKTSSNKSQSKLVDEPVLNDIARRLYLIAVDNERQQRRRQQQQSKQKTLGQRQNMLIKKKKLTIEDIDRLFEEKRLRPASIQRDLYDIYKKSTHRIRSMLDIHQIDQFIENTQKRKISN